MSSERRLYPRYPVNLSIELERGGSVLYVEALNLSMSGMHVECDEAAVKEINPPGFPHYSLRCVLPAEQCVEIVEMKARVIFSRRLSQHRYCLGLQFLSVPERAETILAAYIETLKACFEVRGIFARAG